MAGMLRGAYRDGPASGENRNHLCRLRILGYFGLDPPERGSGLVGNKLISVQRCGQGFEFGVQGLGVWSRI